MAIDVIVGSPIAVAFIVTHAAVMLKLGFFINDLLF